MQKRATMRRLSSADSQEQGPMFVEIMRPDGTSFIQRRTTLKTRLSQAEADNHPPMPKGYSQPKKSP